MIFFYILTFLVFFIFLIDFILQFYTWQSRIHIGRQTNPESWNKKILEKSKQWLQATPTIKLTDNNRLIIIDILKGNYKRNAIQHWQEAALLLGLYENYKKTNSGVIKKCIVKYIDSKINEKGNWKQLPKEIDGVILAYAIINVDFVNHQKNKPVYDGIWQLVQNLIGEDGTAQYRKYTKNYRFVDTIGFICPFLVLYGLKFNKPEAIDLAIKQITSFNENGMLKNHFVPCHTYTITTKLPVGLFGWGRGLGWYAIGLIDSWNALPEDSSYKKVLTESVVAFSKMAMRFQNANGSWSWNVLDATARADSSATATLAWFLVNAAQINTISENCTSAKNKAIAYLMTVTRRDGSIDFSQGDTKGIGVYSQEFDILPFTQGFALRAINYNY